MFIKSRLKHNKLNHIFLQGQWPANDWTYVEARGASMTEAVASNARRSRSACSIQIQPNARPPIAHSLLEKCVYIKYTNIRDDGQGCLHNVNSPLTHWDDLPTNHQPAIIEG